MNCLKVATVLIVVMKERIALGLDLKLLNLKMAKMRIG